MSKHFLEIESFSPQEINEMFNAICERVLGKKPRDVKASLLDMKNAKDDTKVSLTHLMLLIEKNELQFTFKVTYLTGDTLKLNPVEEPNFEAGLKKDPIVTEMASQKQEVVQESMPAQEVPVIKTSDKAVSKSFDPLAIPDFKI